MLDEKEIPQGLIPPPKVRTIADLTEAEKRAIEKQYGMPIRPRTESEMRVQEEEAIDMLNWRNPAVAQKKRPFLPINVQSGSPSSDE